MIKKNISKTILDKNCTRYNNINVVMMNFKSPPTSPRHSALKFGKKVQNREVDLKNKIKNVFNVFFERYVPEEFFFKKCRFQPLR